MQKENSSKCEPRHVVDMRSDTITKPTDEMLKAIMEAEVGDDIYGEDPTVNLLQEKVAKLFGKEAALLVPSGTMGNLICLMVHGNTRGSEALVGDCSHIVVYEQGSIAQIAGVFPREVRTLPDGTLDLVDAEKKIRVHGPESDPHFPFTKVLCLENPHSLMGGRVIHPEYMDKVRRLAVKHDLKVHVDGSRIMNAAVALNLPPSVLLEHADTVTCCLSKGLAAPIGAVIAGTKDFIGQAVRMRKVLGGGMRQAGIIAAPGIVALEVMSKRLHVDHENAKLLASKLVDLKSLGIGVDPSIVDTNMVNFTLPLGSDCTVERFLELLETPQDGPGGHYIVRMLDAGPCAVRATFHYHVTAGDVDKAVQKIENVLRSL